ELTGIGTPDAAGAADVRLGGDRHAARAAARLPPDRPAGRRIPGDRQRPQDAAEAAGAGARGAGPVEGTRPRAQQRRSAARALLRLLRGPRCGPESLTPFAP